MDNLEMRLSKKERFEAALVKTVNATFGVLEKIGSSWLGNCGFAAISAAGFAGGRYFLGDSCVPDGLGDGLIGASCYFLATLSGTCGLIGFGGLIYDKFNSGGGSSSDDSSGYMKDI
jgi:hypothetical protein